MGILMFAQILTLKVWSFTKAPYLQDPENPYQV